MTPAISIRNLSKCYRLGSIGHHTLVEEVEQLWHRLRGRDPRQYMGQIGHSATEARRIAAEKMGSQEFWALQDVSFDVQPGEVIGIIGRNGAGKSTLLKILTRITEPTSGEAIIEGRMGSLLEVGTGFHPELTARENIYMNGAILGMKQHEIATRFDEIVAFSEIGQFLDTPVKRYSSGMYVRLAFAVAAHLEPDILLVDEVLAVGDAAFQNKCIRKMSDVSRAGRTVLFVSHNMGAITRLCSRAILLNAGVLELDGPSSEVAEAYVEGTVSNEAGPIQGDGVLLVAYDVYCDNRDIMGGNITVDSPIRIRVSYEVQQGQLLRGVLAFYHQGNLAFAAVEPQARDLAPGPVWFEVELPGHLLSEGVYHVDVSLLAGENLVLRERVRKREALKFHVTDHMDGTSARGDYAGPFEGPVRPRLAWKWGTGS
mgnify:CR=1 FL=1